MMYVLAAWTGFRKGEIGSLTPDSFCFDVDPPTATVAAAYSKRRREDSQVLHPELARQLKEWLAAKGLGPDDLLSPVSGTLAATGTDGPQATGSDGETASREVPVLVPRGAENGADRVAPDTLRIVPTCTEVTEKRKTATKQSP